MVCGNIMERKWWAPSEHKPSREESDCCFWTRAGLRGWRKRKRKCGGWRSGFRPAWLLPRRHEPSGSSPARATTWPPSTTPSSSRAPSRTGRPCRRAARTVTTAASWRRRAASRAPAPWSVSRSTAASSLRPNGTCGGWRSPGWCGGPSAAMRRWSARGACSPAGPAPSPATSPWRPPASNERLPSLVPDGMSPARRSLSPFPDLYCPRPLSRNRCKSYLIWLKRLFFSYTPQPYKYLTVWLYCVKQIHVICRSDSTRRLIKSINLDSFRIINFHMKIAYSIF